MAFSRTLKAAISHSTGSNGSVLLLISCVGQYRTYKNLCSRYLNKIKHCIEISLTVLFKVMHCDLFWYRLYTCEKLFKILLACDITAVGTINKNRKGIPPKIREANGRKVGEYIIYYDKGSQMTLHSWVTKSSSGKGKAKNVLILSTLDFIRGRTDDDQKARLWIRIHLIQI